MPVNAPTFLQDAGQFTMESMQWCSTESEREVTRIYESLQVLMEDIKRRSNMSINALKAVNDLQEQIKAARSTNNQGHLNDLLAILHRFSSDHVEVAQLISPIIEALQFQDKLRQNLENVGKILHVWLTRQAALKGNDLNEEELKSLGNDFLKCTTSVEERDIIRGFIDGLPEEAKAEDTLFF